MHHPTLGLGVIKKKRRLGFQSFRASGFQGFRVSGFRGFGVSEFGDFGVKGFGSVGLGQAWWGMANVRRSVQRFGSDPTLCVLIQGSG